MRGRLLLLKMVGDGVNRLLSILLTIMRNPGPNAVLLIDEIETGFHYSVYGRLWEAVMNTARENRCQVIATTHSYECNDVFVRQVFKADCHFIYVFGADWKQWTYLYF